MDASLAAGQFVGPAGLGQRALNREGDQFLVPLPAGAAAIELGNRGRPAKLSALTALNVPTPPAKAQLPDEIPFEIEMPLPPSTSGSTSAPPMRIALISFMARLPQAYDTTVTAVVSRCKVKSRLPRPAQCRPAVTDGTTLRRWLFGDFAVADGRSVLVARDVRGRHHGRAWRQPSR